MSQKKREEKELLAFAQQVHDMYETTQKRRVLLFTFLKGVASGLGGVLGATIVVALLLWGLSRLKEVPFIGPLSHSIEQTIEKGKQQ